MNNQRLAIREAALPGLNPEAPLRRGYSIVYGRSGKVIKQADDVMLGELLHITLYKGKIESKVEKTD
jgi:exonuclease VII large subunit